MNDYEDLDSLCQSPISVLTEPITSTDDCQIKSENQVLSSNDSPYTLSLRRNDFADEKEMERFIKSCERLIRMSPEYRIWTDYIRSVLGYYRCEITGESHQETTVDIHHHPFSLYAITKAAILRNEASGKEFCSYDISSEVIQLHYDMRVPFCLLISSLHEKFHNGALMIPMDLVHGDVQYFITTYLSFLDDDAVESITNRLGVTKENCGWEKGYRWVSAKECND